MANYVKFLRGTPAAYASLPEKNNDTLYFIYEENESSGLLYLGSKLIAGNSTIEGAQFLNDLQDVLIGANLHENDCLIYDISGQWVNKPIIDILPVFIGTLGETDGTAGLVPAPSVDQINMFLRSDGTWAEVVTASIETDNVTLENVDGVLSIVGFNDAPEGAQPVKNQDGSLGWVKPDLTAVETLQEDVENIKQILNPADENNGLISDVEDLKESVGNAAEYDEEGNLTAAATGLYAELDKKADAEETQIALDSKANAAEVEEALDLKANTAEVNDALNLKANASDVEEALDLKANVADVYTRTDTDNAIAAAIANVDHLSREVVDILPDAEDADPNIIYMIPSGLQEDDNKYYEWILVNGIFEQVGSWEVDLGAYAKTADVETALSGKVDKDGNSRLMTLSEGTKLEGIEENAEKNIINSVSTDFEIISDDSHDRELTLKPIAISKVINLEDQLNNKVDKKEGWTLLSPDDQIKLDKLSVDDNGEVGISGTVSAANVQELYNTVVDIVTGEGTGLYDKELKPLLGIEIGAEKNYINSVNESQLIVENRQLAIKAIDLNIVTGLNEALNTKASSDSVKDIEDLLNTQYQNHEARIASLEGRLTWQYMIDNNTV